MSVRITCGACGFASTSKTRPLADGAIRRHSCEKEGQRQAARRRARQRATRSEPRPCIHPRVHHEHGTYLAYVRDRCRCIPCRTANSANTAERTRAKLYGRYDALVDAEPVRAYIRYLSAQGVGLKQITRVTGVSGGVLTKLVYGHPLPDGTRRPPSRRCSRHVRDRILSVTPGMAAGGSLVDAAGTRRRLQALVCLGWSQSKIAARLGINRANFTKTINATRVTKATSEAARALYDELWNQTPPHDEHRDKIAYRRSLRYAAEHGWHPPLAWDDESIDDAAALPMQADDDVALDEIAVERIMAGTLTVPRHSQSPERLEAIRRLAALGLTDSEIGRRISMQHSAVGWTRNRHGIPAGQAVA